MVTTVSTGSSLFAPSQLGMSRLAQQAADSAARLTGGNRILRNGDDAAGISIATRLQSQIFEYRQAAQDIVATDSLVSIAKEALERLRDKLTEAAEIADEASADTLIAQERAQYQKQLDVLQEDIDSIVENTKFENRNLLDGTFADEDIRVGSEDTDFVNLAISDVSAEGLFGEDALDITTSVKAATVASDIEDALENVGNIIGSLEGVEGQISSASSTISSTLSGVSLAESAITDTDEDTENLDLAQTQLKLDIGSAVIAQASRISDDLLNILEFKIELEAKPELNTSEEKEDVSSGEDTSEQSTGVNASSSEEAA